MAKKSSKYEDILDKMLKRHEKSESKAYESKEGGKKRKDLKRFKR